MARRAELSVLPGARDLTEHVLVEIALGVAVLHRHGGKQVHHLGQQRRRGDGEARILHVMGIGGTIPAQRPQPRKNVLADNGVHLGRREILEMRPPEMLIRALLRILARREDAVRHRLFQPRGLVLLQRVQVVQAAQEEQVSDLLNDFERVGNAAGPECVPDLVDLALDGAGDHFPLFSGPSFHTAPPL